MAGATVGRSDNGRPPAGRSAAARTWQAARPAPSGVERRVHARGRRPRPAGSAARRSSPAAAATGPAAIRGCRRARPRRPAGRRSSPAAPRCTGGARRAAARLLGWSSTIRPAYMTITRSVASSTTPRSWLIRIAVKPLSRCRSLIVRITAFCTITSSAVVGSSKTISFGSSASASAIETRCRMPPDSSCGNRLEHVGRQPHLLQQLRAPRRRRRRLEASSPARAWARRMSREVLLDAAHRVERVHAALQHQREAVAALGRAAPRRQGGHVDAVEDDAAAVSRAGGRSIRVSAKPSVDLPQPDSPTRPTNSPCSRVRLDVAYGVHGRAAGAGS